MKLEHFFRISLLLFALWATSLLVFHTVNVTVHILLVLAVMFYVGHLLRHTSIT